MQEYSVDDHWINCFIYIYKNNNDNNLFHKTSLHILPKATTERTILRKYSRKIKKRKKTENQNEKTNHCLGHNSFSAQSSARILFWLQLNTKGYCWCPSFSLWFNFSLIMNTVFKCLICRTLNTKEISEFVFVLNALRRQNAKLTITKKLKIAKKKLMNSKICYRT